MKTLPNTNTYTRMICRMTPPQEDMIIQFYTDNPVLWKPNHPKYFKRDHRQFLLTKLRHKLKATFGIDVTISEIKQKFKILRSSYLRENRKIQKSLKCGSESSIHVPKWIHFSKLKFLEDALNESEHSRTDADLETEDFVDESLEENIGLEESEDSNLRRLLFSATQTSAQQLPVKTEPINSSSCPSISFTATSDAAPDRASSNRNMKNSDTGSQFIQTAIQYLGRSCKPSLSNAEQVVQARSCEEVFGMYVATTLQKLDEDDQEDCKVEIQTVLSRYMKNRKK